MQVKFHFDKAMLIWAGVTLAALAGCGTNGSSKEMNHMAPQSVAVTMHQAIAAKDYDRVCLCVAPEYRGSMRSVLAAWKEYSAKATQTAALVEKRVDPAPAQRMRDELDQAYQQLLPSPLAGVVTDGKVQWERVQIAPKDDSATLEIDQQPTPFGKKFSLVRVKGAWYVAPAGKAKTFALQASQAVQGYSQCVRDLDRLQDRIRKGQVHRDNIAKELSPGGAEKPGVEKPGVEKPPEAGEE
jgi:hypothetical protein